MTWKDIADAPRDGTWLELGHVDHSYTQRGRWGLHRQSGEERWVDGAGHGLFNATHFDYPRVPPKAKSKVGPAGVGTSRDRWHVEYDDNGDPYSIYDARHLSSKLPPDTD